MSSLAGNTTERMRSAFTIEMSATTKQAHEASISTALNTVGATTHGVRTPRWRVRVPALVAGLMVALPLGTAVASEGAVPGDLLYPIKRLVEPIRSVVDPDVAAQHRVEELARLIDSPASSDRVADAVFDARDAVGDLPADHLLRAEFDKLTDRLAESESVVVPFTDDENADHPVSDTNTNRLKTDVSQDRTEGSDLPTDLPSNDSPIDTRRQDDRPHLDSEEPQTGDDSQPRDG